MSLASAPVDADVRQDPCKAVTEASTVMDKKILDFLRNRDWTDAAELMKGVGAARKNEVNPTLYALERQGQIQKDTSTEKPQWKLLESATPELHRLLGGFVFESLGLACSGMHMRRWSSRPGPLRPAS